MIILWHGNSTAFKCKIQYTTATEKFPTFLCRSLTTYRNFCLPPSPLELIQRSQRDFHDRRHFWKSYCFSVFITFCDTVWISLMLSKRRPLSFNFIFGNRKKITGDEVRWVGRMGDDCRIRRSQNLPHKERRVSRSVVMMQDPGVVAPLVWMFAPDVFPQSPRNVAI